MTEAVICFTTVGKEKDARSMARDLVKGRIAACVQIVPKIVSCYEWDGDLQEDSETLLLIKTTRARVEALKSRLEAQHPYEIPELLVVEATDGFPAYLEWLGAATS